MPILLSVYLCGNKVIVFDHAFPFRRRLIVYFEIKVDTFLQSRQEKSCKSILKGSRTIKAQKLIEENF